MQFIDKKVHLKGYLHIFRVSKSYYMDNYFITLGTYLILMLFFKIYYAVSVKE